MIRRWWNRQIEKSRQMILDNSAPAERRKMAGSMRLSIEFLWEHDRGFRWSILIAALLGLLSFTGSLLLRVYG